VSNVTNAADMFNRMNYFNIQENAPWYIGNPKTWYTSW